MTMSKKWIALLLGVSILAAALTGCSESKKEGGKISYDPESGLPQFTEPADDDQVAVLHTSMGDLTLRFFPEQAPKAVENFLTHAQNGYYDDVIFHRVIEGFVIQGGDPEGTGMGGESIWGGTFGYETSDDLFHFRGALAMAHSSLPDSNGSQFYIVQGEKVSEDDAAYLEAMGYPQSAAQKYVELGGTPTLDTPFGQEYTVFGQLIDGYEVLDAIAAVKTSQEDRPEKDVVIESIEVKAYQDLQ